MKVCILAAGIGSRSFSQDTHKALLPLGNKAVLSRIIKQFPAKSIFIIAVGHGAQQIKDFIAIAHPSLAVHFVSVDPYEGVGSGPGYSLLSCKAFLQEPFIFTACDTLITDSLPTLKTNWLGVAPVDDIEHWCSVVVTHGVVKQIVYKTKHVPTNLAFVGIAGIKDYHEFWLGLEAASNDGEIQVNAGLECLAHCGLNATPLSWQDTGDAHSYYQLLLHYDKNYSFAGKTTELTYRYNQTIIKYFADHKSAHARFTRAADYPNIFPRVLQHRGHFLSYAFQKGRPLSQTLDQDECTKFLAWAETVLWKAQPVNRRVFRTNIRRFYADKTKERVDRFYGRFGFDPQMRRAITINDMLCKPIDELICQAMPLLEHESIPSTFHGDLHADNIITTKHGYVLIDWRDSFGDSIKAGDRYYDLGKFYHTLDLSVAAMDKAQFTISSTAGRLYIEHHADKHLKSAQQAFWDFVATHGYNRKIIEFISGLVFLNMAALYDKALGEYLYYLGRHTIQNAIGGT